MTKQLYCFKPKNSETEHFGYFISRSSKNEWIMETVNGEVIVTSQTRVEAVIPHTILVKNLLNKRCAHLLADADTFKVGDMFLGRDGGGILLILEVDTKDTSATVEFKPVAKFTMEKL